jgi:hypothetical protein
MALLTRGRGLLAAALAAALLPSSLRAQPEPGEKAIKAAFLYNFTKFVEWPDSASAKLPGGFRVCVFSDPQFRRELEAMLTGEAVGNKTLEVITPGPNDVRSCHVVFFSASEAERAGQLLPALKQSPVLTVGEGPRFLAQGGLISFVVEDNRVRFDVNKAGIDRAKLTVSSKLLRVARHVETGGRRP